MIVVVRADYSIIKSACCGYWFCDGIVILNLMGAECLH